MSLASSELWQFTSYLKSKRKGLERQGLSSALAPSAALQWGRLFGAPVGHPLTQPSSLLHDQEGRRGLNEVVPGPSVFPSGEPGVSGCVW